MICYTNDIKKEMGLNRKSTDANKRKQENDEDIQPSDCKRRCTRPQTETNNTDSVNSNNDSFLEILLEAAYQKDFEPISTYFTEDNFPDLKKMGNGCNAQVFGSKMKEVALKVMPIEEADTRPHRSVMTVAEAFNEVVATIQLSRLAYVENTHFRTDNYVELKQIRLFRGCTPELLRRAWQSHNEKSGKNGEIYYDNFSEQQKWIVMELELCHGDLHKNLPPCPLARQSIFTQIALALAVAEQTYQFEHRDLHFGNILLASDCRLEDSCNHQPPSVIFDGEVLQPCKGPTVKLSDFAISRITLDNNHFASRINVVANSNPPSNIKVYIDTRKEAGSRCVDFRPRNNVIWLTYLAKHILVEDWEELFNGEQSIPPCDRHYGRFSDGIAELDMNRRLEYVNKWLVSAKSAGHFIRRARRFMPYLFCRWPKTEIPPPRLYPLPNCSDTSPPIIEISDDSETDEPLNLTKGAA